MKAARALVLLAFALGGCQAEVPPENAYQHPAPVPCGRINAVDLVGLPERAAVRYARDGGCELRVVTQGRRAAPSMYEDEVVPRRGTVNVTILDGYVHRLGR